jgi:hypothetical protein
MHYCAQQAKWMARLEMSQVHIVFDLAIGDVSLE